MAHPNKKEIQKHNKQVHNGTSKRLLFMCIECGNFTVFHCNTCKEGLCNDCDNGGHNHKKR